ncbi:hypothetical protein COC42_00355 [Sphingomonas spermidinifaciens]|uniref:Acyltransferase 3 domain-containing protein n=1 Tax=Sphingomonas spermidinifaciens TaxID=1141889 RepID=A0A2A4B167_9SPHN|nr:acyltransferase family protein [Sphingomonas spermidinifaciens]PCD02933.1 hypothetical protein COC42_00355 [Sphingomonas spermidinifaciens]
MMVAPRHSAVPEDSARWMDAARAALAVAVAFSHAWLLFVTDHRPGDPWISYPFYFASGFAHTAVILFFVLSGFWIAKSVEALDRRGWRWRDFLLDRWTRLGIVVLPVLVLGGALDYLGFAVLRTPVHLNAHDVWFLPRDMARSLGPVAFAGNLAFLQSILVPPLGTNGPLWSVAFEFWYYLWFAALWLLVRHRRFSVALLLLVLAAASRDLAAGFLAWLVGAAIWLRGARLAIDRFWPIALFFAATLLWSRLGDRPGEDLVVAGVAGLFLAALLRRNPRFPARLAPVARFGASGSFSLYAIHFPVMAMVAGLSVWPGQLPPGPAGIAAALAAVGGAVMLAIGYARLTEANTGRLRNWLRGSLQTAIRPAE